MWRMLAEAFAVQMHRGRAKIIFGGGGDRLKGAGCRKRQSK